MILRLIAAHGDSLDPAIRCVEDLLIVRRIDGCFAQVADERTAAFVRELAYAGIQADPADTDLTPQPGAILATAGDLRPAPLELVTSDTLRVRPLPLGAATAEVLRRSFALFRAPSAEAQRKCRRLLRNEDLMFAWQRQAVVERRAVGSVRRRSSLRPVVFDRAALGWTGRERRALVSDGLLARWAFR